MHDVRDRPTREEAAPLVQALAGSAGGLLGVPVLALKGPALTVQGLRQSQLHADVDVLVAPRDVRSYVDGLVSLGWREQLGSSAPTIMPSHSVNLLCDFWPVTIDVHHYFPGFLAPAEDVFEVLWTRRAEVTLAQVPVATLDPAAHAIVAALHLLREQRAAVRRAELVELAARTRAVVGVDGVSDLVALARRTGASAPIRPFLECLGGEVGDVDEHDPDLALWNLRATSHASYPWLYLLRRTPLHRWPATVWRAVMLTDDEIRLYHADPHRDLSVGRLRWRRIRRGLRSVPRAVMVHGKGAVRRRTGRGRTRTDEGGDQR